MKFANDLMSDPKVQYDKIGHYVKRSIRNSWPEMVEPIVRELCPWPISYDVTAIQPLNFSEYSYTEFCSGMVTHTQSKELDAKLYLAASKVEAENDYHLQQLSGSLSDKYIMEDVPDRFKHVKKIVFLPGHNMLDVASVEQVSKLANEEEDVYFKPHPITRDETISGIAKRVGWHKVIPKDVSGFALLLNCDEVYTTSASEMSITGTALDKKVINISNYLNEGVGAYHALSRLIFRAHEKVGLEEAKRILNNVISCEWSGYIFPWQSEEEVRHRLKSYYDKSLELREIYKPLTAGIGNYLTASRKVDDDGSKKGKPERPAGR